jgi:hypothetical protein
MLHRALGNDINKDWQNVIHCLYLKLPFVMVNYCCLDSIETLIDTVQFIPGIRKLFNLIYCFDSLCIRDAVSND